MWESISLGLSGSRKSGHATAEATAQKVAVFDR